ncbi:MAG: hypothetical protein IPJ94_17710 [Chloroflexi bacterium]|nr:hypothetical protein [Chloroflexota bacterium]
MLASPLRKAGFPILAVSYRKEDLISLLTQHQPDVLIVNLSFYDPDMRLAVARRLPQLKVVVVSALVNADYFAVLTEHLFAEGRAHAFIGLGDTYDLEGLAGRGPQRTLSIPTPIIRQHHPRSNDSASVPPVCYNLEG